MNNDQGGRVAVVQQQLFPPPPEFYKLYDEEADGSEDHPLPPLPPKLPTKEYTMFGEIHTTEDGIPPLRVRQLFVEDNFGRIDFKKSLLDLHGELVAAVQDLLHVLTQQPSTYARSLEAVGLLLRNMSHLARVMRPHQARATLASMLRSETAVHKTAAQSLHVTSEECDETARNSLDQLSTFVEGLCDSALVERTTQREDRHVQRAAGNSVAVPT